MALCVHSDLVVAASERRCSYTCKLGRDGCCAIKCSAQGLGQFYCCRPINMVDSTLSPSPGRAPSTAYPTFRSEASRHVKQ